MKKKRILSALVAAAAAFCFVLPPGRAAVLPQPVTASAEDAADGLSVSKSKVKYGDYIDVTVNVPAVSANADTVEIRVDFDPNAFEVTSWRPQLTNSALTNYSNTAGFFVIAAANINYSLNNGLSFTGRLRVKNNASSGAYVIKLSSYDVCNYDTGYRWTPVVKEKTVKVASNLVSVSGTISVKATDNIGDTASVIMTDSDDVSMSTSVKLSFNSSTNMYEGTYIFNEAEANERYTVEITIPGCKPRSDILSVGNTSLNSEMIMRIPGDVDGDGKVGASDATQVLKYLVGTRSEIRGANGVIDKYLLSVAHVTNTSELSPQDATQILRYVARLTPTL